MPKKKVNPETEQPIETQLPLPVDSGPEGQGTPAENEQTSNTPALPEPLEGEPLPPAVSPPDDIPEIVSVEPASAEDEEAVGKAAEGTEEEMPTPKDDDAEAPMPEQTDGLDREAAGQAGPTEYPNNGGVDELGGSGRTEADGRSDGNGEPKAEEVSKRTAARHVREEQAPEGSEDSSPATPPEETPPPPANERQAFYGLDFNALDRDLSPEQRQEWNSIYASYRGRSALTGTVVGIDRHAINVRDKATGEMVRQEMYCAIVIPFRVRILIPAAEMWAKGEERPSFVLRNMTGASIDFVIIHVDREAGFALGSRRLALGTRRYYFSTQPSMSRPGSRVKCRVLAVGPRRCLVECGGYDVNLTQREMRYTAIPDLRDEYHPGQELDCVVKNYGREGNMLTISVKETNPNPFDGAELRHPEGSRRQAVIAGKYAGGVFCNLPDGAVVMCSYSFHYDDSAFAIGDKVIVVIQRYDFGKKQIYGKIVAKW